MENLNLTFDYYDIAITDRIVISNRVPFQGGEVEFFTNSIDTRTTGVDVVVDYKNINIGPGTLGLAVAGNVNLKNEREGAILQVRGVNVIDETQEALFFTSRPKQKVVGTATYQMDRMTVALNNTYFGPTEFKQTGIDPSLKTVFEPKVVTDIGITYQLFSNVTISANILNALDVLPKWKFEAVDANGENILAGRPNTRNTTVKQQTNLLTFNGRYSIMTYDGYHFSQLGRIYNLSLNYSL